MGSVTNMRYAYNRVKCILKLPVIVKLGSFVIMLIRSILPLYTFLPLSLFHQLARYCFCDIRAKRCTSLPHFDQRNVQTKSSQSDLHWHGHHDGDDHHNFDHHLSVSELHQISTFFSIYSGTRAPCTPIRAYRHKSTLLNLYHQVVPNITNL